MMPKMCIISLLFQKTVVPLSKAVREKAVRVKAVREKAVREKAVGEKAVWEKAVRGPLCTPVRRG